MSNFYNKFDKGTSIKLNLLSRYLNEWFPVFLMSGVDRNIKIIDFFCGPGKDKKNNEGSPLRIIKIIKEFEKKHEKEFRSKNIEIIFNDSNSKYIKDLEEYIENNHSISRGIKQNITYRNLEFKYLFSELENKLRHSANFIFLDQYGVKEVTKEIFRDLASIPKTDFMFFISSSFIQRFIKTPEFKNLEWMDKDKIQSANSTDIHRILAGEYGRIAPKGAYVIPFTIKKGRNVYGLVFYARHLRAADKFLQVAWKEDPVSGEANFDINEDEFQQLDFFDEKIKKIEAFKKKLKDSILESRIASNVDVYRFAILHGFLPSHAREAIKELRDDRCIRYDSRLVLSYKSCIKEKKIIKFEVVKEP